MWYHFAGAGLYLSSGRALSNNTAIYHSCRSCEMFVYCYSNSTAHNTNAAYITTPNNAEQNSYYYNAISIQQVSPSGIRLRYTYTNHWRWRSPTSGIYVCGVHDSHGDRIHLSFGLYFSQPSKFLSYPVMEHVLANIHVNYSV